MLIGRGTESELAPVAGSVGRARAIVRDLGRGLPDRLVDDAELLVSELVSNAVQHGGAGIRLAVARESATSRQRWLSVRVYDESSRLPVVTPVACAPDLPSGRGLRMVQAIATEWGVDVDPAGRGKTVWFCICEPFTPDPDRSVTNENLKDRAPWSL